MIAASDAGGQKFVVPQEMLEEVQKALPGKEILSQIGGSKLVNIASNPISKALVTKCLNGDIVADVKQLTSDPKEVLKNIAGNAVTSGVIASGFLGQVLKSWLITNQHLILRVKKLLRRLWQAEMPRA